MLLRLLSFLCLLSLPQGVLAQHSGMPTREPVPETCPVTKRDQTSLFLPPPPYRTKAGNGRFWFGTDRLWTNLPDNGILPELADEMTSAHPAISEKVFWWRQGYDARLEPRPRLRVTGKRIDSPAPPLESRQPPTHSRKTLPPCWWASAFRRMGAGKLARGMMTTS